MPVPNQKPINGRTFSFGDIPPREAIHVECMVIKVIGEPLFKALVGAKEAGIDVKKIDATPKAELMKAGSSIMGAALGQLAAGLSADDSIDLMERVFKHTSCDGKPITDLDVCFAGRNKREPWEVLIAALTFNFQDVFPESLFASLAAKAKVMLK